jgi:hypothetical protein
MNDLHQRPIALRIEVNSSDVDQLRKTPGESFAQ